MPALNTDKLLQVGKPGTATNLASPGHTIGGTSITVGSTTNWPTATAVAFAIDRAELVGGQEVQIPGTYTEWIGVVTGATTIGSMTISSDSPNSDQNYSAGSLTRVYIPVSATRENKIVEWGLVHADQDGTLKADAVDVTAVIKDAVITPQKLNSRTRLGWIDNELSAVSTVTHNGNRSYDVVFASTVASILSEGMRLEFTKVTAGNAYMGGAFNGSSHYFTKTSPGGTLGTVTNNFTIEAVVQPTSYAQGIITGRAESTANNGFGLRMEADGRLTAMVYSGGSANYRTVSTYQSLPLNKKTHVAMSWTSGTVVIYFDGISVPVAAATTGGSAPTAAGTGGDFSIGRWGAFTSQYFAGYISNVAVFDAVLSASTIKDHYTKKLTGSETNCIGAWSLDNTANDQSSAGNNLTATGGVGYTAQSPHGQLGSGVDTTKSVGLVMAVSGSTAVVQVPEGCTIPTSGGVSAVAYSTQANPYGWVSDKSRWALIAMGRTINSKATPAASTYYFTEAGSVSLSVPIGNFVGTGRGIVQADKAGNNASPIFAVSTSSSSSPDTRTTKQVESYQANISAIVIPLEINNSAATTYYCLLGTTSSPPTNIYIRGDVSPTEINLIPSCL